MEKQEKRMNFPSIDEMFSTEKERLEKDLEKVQNIPISEIDDFPDHPFKVLDNPEFQELVESIREKGVLVPVIVRPKANEKYEMIAGHRRKKASEILNIDTIPCLVRNLDKNEATIIMVDSNLQREKILPSEKAFAYKMKLEASSHQGKATSRQVVEKLLTVDLIGKAFGDSGRKVQRYIRLTELIPELLQLVDNEALEVEPKMGKSQGVELSFLTKQEQKELWDFMKFFNRVPSHDQAIRIRNLSKSHELTQDKIKEIIGEQKPNERETIRVSMNRLCNVLPQNLKNNNEREEYIIKALKFYDKYLKARERKLQER